MDVEQGGISGISTGAWHKTSGIHMLKYWTAILLYMHLIVIPSLVVSFPILIGLSTEMSAIIRWGTRVSRWRAAAIWSRGFASTISVQAPVVNRLGVVGAGQMVCVLREFLPEKLTLDIGPWHSLCCCQSCASPCDISRLSAGFYR